MHRREQFFTATKLYYDSPRSVGVGQFLRSTAGAVFLVERVRQSPSRHYRRYLDVLRYDPGQLPADAIIHPLYWYPRKTKVGARTRVTTKGVA